MYNKNRFERTAKEMPSRRFWKTLVLERFGRTNCKKKTAFTGQRVRAHVLFGIDPKITYDKVTSKSPELVFRVRTCRILRVTMRISRFRRCRSFRKVFRCKAADTMGTKLRSKSSSETDEYTLYVPRDRTNALGQTSIGRPIS